METKWKHFERIFNCLVTLNGDSFWLCIRYLMNKNDAPDETMMCNCVSLESILGTKEIQFRLNCFRFPLDFRFRLNVVLFLFLDILFEGF